MPSRVDMDDSEIDEAPTAINPYEVLNLDKDATADQVKTAYRKAALKWHPDKATPEDKDAAHTKFQEVAFAYAILSDERRRRRYDITGRTEDSLDLESDDTAFDWTAFYREQFADIITGDAIAKFTDSYKGSAEERDALLQAYGKSKGDMTKIYELVMASDPIEDDARFRTILRDAIDKGDVEPYDKFTKESEKSVKARIERAKRDAREAEAYAKEIGVHDKLFVKGDKAAGGSKKGKADAGDGRLAALIQQRQKGRADNFLADLEAKYAPKASGKAGKKRARPVMDEPPEEAFQRNAKKVSKEVKAEETSSGTRKSKRTKA